MFNFLHKYLRLPYRLHVIDKTIGQPKETLVFLHGIAGSSAMWEKVVGELSDVRVIRVDLLGFGESARPTHLDYTIIDHAQMLHYTLKRCRIKGKVRVIGYSLGALVAVEYATHHKNQIRSLILCAPPLYTNEELLEDNKKTIADHQSTALLNLYREFRKRPDWTIEAAAKAKLVLPIARTMTITEDYWFSFYHTLKNSIEQQTSLRDIEQLRKPVTIVYGTADPVIITGHIKEVAKKNDAIKVVSILGGTHLLDKRFRSVLLKEIKRQLDQ